MRQPQLLRRCILACCHTPLLDSACWTADYTRYHTCIAHVCRRARRGQQQHQTQTQNSPLRPAETMSVCPQMW